MLPYNYYYYFFMKLNQISEFQNDTLTHHEVKSSKLFLIYTCRLLCFKVMNDYILSYVDGTRNA